VQNATGSIPAGGENLEAVKDVDTSKEMNNVDVKKFNKFLKD